MGKINSGRASAAAALFVLTVGLRLAPAAPVVTGGGGEGVTTDLFDVAQGASVLDNSPMLGCCGGSFPENAIGGSGGVEPPHTLFSDGPITTIEFINIRTASPIRLTGYTATLADDSDNPNNPGDPNRGAMAFRLYTSPDADFTNPTLVSSVALNSPYSTNYGSNAILINDTLTDVTGQFFQIWLTRVGAGGPRIREVDGFGTVVPEPSVAALLLAGPVGLLLRRRRSLP